MFWLRKWSIAAITILSIGGALAYSFRQTPVFESETRLLVAPPVSERAVAPPVLNLETEKELVASMSVAELAAESLGERTPEELLEDVNVDVTAGTEILSISYADPDPVRAQRGARAFAEAYLSYRRQQAVDDLLAASRSVQGRIDDLGRRLERVNHAIARTEEGAEKNALEVEATTLVSQLAILQQQLSDLTTSEVVRVGQVVQPAARPTTPASPNVPLNAALALVSGLAIALGLTTVRERLDDRIRTHSDIEEAASAPALGVVPRVPGWRRRSDAPLITGSDPTSRASEAYRSLRTSVLFAAAQSGVRVLLVTSAHAGEGKSATTANLGVALAQGGNSVILVSADLRKPRLHRFFRVNARTGLTNVLAGEMDISGALHTPAQGLQIVPSGPVPANPAVLLASDAMARVITELKQLADFVLIDTPPVLAVSDAITLASFSDAALLVAQAGRGTKAALRLTRRQLDQVGARVIGAILNNVQPSRSPGGAYYHPYYDAYGGNGASSRRRAGRRKEARPSRLST